MTRLQSMTILCLLSAYGHASTTSYAVAPGSVRNSITLEVTNKLSHTLEHLAVAAEKKPGWITITRQELNRTQLLPDSTTLVSISFDVGSSFVAGERGEVVVVLYSGASVVLRKSFPLVGAYPEQYELSQNYPNPFNPTTQIKFALPKESQVKLTVYDVLGRQVIVLVDEQKPAGFFTGEWDGTNSVGNKVSSGVYFYRMEVHATDGRHSYTGLKKAIMMK